MKDRGSLDCCLRSASTGSDALIDALFGSTTPMPKLAFLVLNCKFTLKFCFGATSSKVDELTVIVESNRYLVLFLWPDIMKFSKT
jgi:hypothetical protein